MSTSPATLPELSAAQQWVCPDLRGAPAAVVSPRLLVVVRWPVGGIRTHLQVNYPVLARAGYRFTFVGPDDGSLDALRAGLFGADDPGDAEFVTVPLRGRNCPLWRPVRRLLQTGRFALVHAHGVTAAAHAVLAGLGGRGQSVPLVVTLHEPFRPSQFTGLRGRLRRWLLGLALRRAAAVVTVSADARDNLLGHFRALRARSGRLLTLPNGIDAPRFAGPVVGSEVALLRRRLGLGPAPALVGFLGRFMPEKGFPLLLEAAARVAAEKDAPPFHVVAFGSGDYRREYQRAVEQRGLAGRITLLDAVADVRPMLGQLDLVVVPSLWEASSLVSMEAMAVGVPVLGSDCPGLREVLRDTPSRMVPTDDAAALARGLRLALDAPWAAAARAFAPVARTRFDNARSARRLAALFDGLIGRMRDSGAC